MKTSIQMAEQQFQGYYRCQQGETIGDLVNAMGLTEHEYREMDKQGMLDYLPEEFLSEIEEELQIKT